MASDDAVSSQEDDESRKATLDHVEPPITPEWKAGSGEYLVVFTLCLLALIVALDASILVPVLPVSRLASYQKN